VSGDGPEGFLAVSPATITTRSLLSRHRTVLFRSLAAVVIALTSTSCSAPPKPSPPRSRVRAQNPTVRVGLETGLRQVRIEGNRLRGQMGTVRKTTLLGLSFVFAARGAEFRVDNGGRMTTGQRTICVADGPIKINGKPYRGAVEILATPDGITVVNELAVEAYLRGVVPKEIGDLGPREFEAVKAQAIAARTYTLSYLGRRADLGFDLWDDTRDQVYDGLTAETTSANRAVAETRGVVIAHNGGLVQSYFHSTCGGSTVNMSDVWPAENRRFVSQILDRDEAGWYCQKSHHFRWTEVYSAARLKQILNRHLKREMESVPGDVGRVLNVVAEATAPSGRVQATTITTERGRFSIPKERVRWVLRRPIDGEPILRSSYVRYFVDADSEGKLARLMVSGAGNGHGIGMCQTGAAEMARRGYSSQQILAHYYQDSELQKWPNIEGVGAPTEATGPHGIGDLSYRPDR